jgi:Tfp pilus assembly protein PilF
MRRLPTPAPLVTLLAALLVGCVSMKKQDQAGARVGLGAAYLQEGNSPAAVEELQEAVKLDPRNWNGWNKLGLAYLSQGATDRAEVAFRKALKLAPDNAEVNNNFAYMLSRTGRYDEAAVYYQAALEDLTYRKPALVLSNWGHTLYLAGRYEEAVARLDQAVQRAPNLCQARFNRGLALEAAGRKTPALEDFEAVISLCGDEAAGAYLQAGKLLLEQKDKAGACEYLRTATRMSSDPRGRESELGRAAADLHAREC